MYHLNTVTVHFPVKYIFTFNCKDDKHGQTLKAQVSVTIHTHLPTWSVCKYNITFFIASFNKCDTRVLFPVPHSLFEHGALGAWKNNCMR